MSTRNNLNPKKNQNQKNKTNKNNTNNTTYTRNPTSSLKRSTNNATNKKSNINLTTNIDALVAYVMKKYEESLFMPYLEMNNQHKRAMFYLERIIDRIRISGIKMLGKFENEIEFLTYFIFSTVHFLNPTNFSPNPNVNCILYHGSPSLFLAQVPKNCVICFTTPINYLGCQSTVHVTELFDSINANVDTFITSFLENPFCLKDLPHILEPAITFLPGQFYTDVVLSYDNDGSFNGLMGLYISSEKSQLVKQDILNEDKKKIYLSRLIKGQSLKGIIIVNCCRSFDSKHKNNSRARVNAGSDTYRYEHFSNIVNKAVWAKGNDEKYFEPCIRSKLYPDLFKKTSDFPEFNLINNAIDEKQIGNRSLGTAQHIPKLTGMSPNLLKLFIDQKNNEMTDEALYEELDKIFENYPRTLKNKLIDVLSERINGNLVSTKLFNDISITNVLLKYNPLFPKLVNRLYKYFIDRYNKKNKSDDYLPRIFKDKTPAELDMLENTLTF